MANKRGSKGGTGKRPPEPRTKVVKRNIEEEAQGVATPPQPRYVTQKPKGARRKK